MKSEFEIENVKLDTKVFPSDQSKIRSGHYFIKGPIPLFWLFQAARLEGKVVNVAMAIWFKIGLQKTGDTVSLNLSRLKYFGVSRNSAAKALVKLENCGLVSVLRKPGSCPQVTVNTKYDETFREAFVKNFFC